MLLIIYLLDSLHRAASKTDRTLMAASLEFHEVFLVLNGALVSLIYFNEVSTLIMHLVLVEFQNIALIFVCDQCFTHDFDRPRR